MPVADLTFLHAPSVYDFRQRATLWGPISDLIPSAPVYDMYPVGFAVLCDYLERHGMRARIANLAVRMLRSSTFDVEKYISRLRSRAFGIDLHWLPHAHGSIEIARLVRKHHPGVPIIFGGYSATYYHQELVRYPQVDYVLRGDSTEEPLRQLLECLQQGGEPTDIPNLTWKDSSAHVHVNAHSYRPSNLDHIRPGFRQMVRSVVRDRDLFSYAPFSHWLDYPIMATLTVRGCTQHCAICGGCADGHSTMSGRTQPAFRRPEDVAQDVRDARRISRGPVMIIGDLRLGGRDYARRFFRAIQGVPGPFIVEFFWPVSRAYAEELGAALPGFIAEFSPDSHDPVVRRALGKNYSDKGIEQTIQSCLRAGARRFDLFYLIGLQKQTANSVLQTVDDCERLLERVNGDGRLVPFISPLAPFLDPASPAYEDPGRHGYKLYCRTLEDHRQALLSPTWKHILSYETSCMNRDAIADVTYQAGRRLNRIKARHGLIAKEKAAETEQRIDRARDLMDRIDQLLETASPEQVDQEMLAMKSEIDQANTSTVCDKRELDIPLGWIPFNVPGLAKLGSSVLWELLQGDRNNRHDHSS